VRDTFVHQYLNQQHLPDNHFCKRCTTKVAEFRCLDCFGQGPFCHSCCLEVHSSHPFHSIEKWTGGFFKKTSLHAEGFILHLGHGGLCCPANVTSPNTGLEATEEGEWGEDNGVLLEAWEPRDKRTLVIIGVSGVYQLIVSWCCCPDAPDHTIQLFQHQLFPASMFRPSTAFTFAVLQYFHIDAVECKTSASNFSNKLRRLTDFSSPQSVPVSKIYFIYYTHLISLRIGIVN